MTPIAPPMLSTPIHRPINIVMPEIPRLQRIDRPPTPPANSRPSSHFRGLDCPPTLMRSPITTNACSRLLSTEGADDWAPGQPGFERARWLPTPRVTTGFLVRVPQRVSRLVGGSGCSCSVGWAGGRVAHSVPLGMVANRVGRHGFAEPAKIAAVSTESSSTAHSPGWASRRLATAPAC